jgi:hypothetical protein
LIRQESAENPKTQTIHWDLMGRNSGNQTVRTLENGVPFVDGFFSYPFGGFP